MLLRKRKRLEENDKKSGKSRRVWKSLWGSYAAGTGTFLMCGHHFVQHKEDVGAHLLSVLHSGFPQKVSVNVKNVFLLLKGLCHEGSFRTIIWLKMSFSPVWQFLEKYDICIFSLRPCCYDAIFEITDSVQSRYWSTFVCVSKAYNLNFFFFNFFGYIGYKDTRSSIKKLMNFRYQKTKPNGQ